MKSVSARLACIAAVLCLNCAGALSAAAETETTATETAAAETVTTAAETAEAETDAAETEETQADADGAEGDVQPGSEEGLYRTGDYEYSRFVNQDDEALKAVCIEHYYGKEADLVIPEELNGLQVIKLGDYAFANNQSIQTVKIPQGVEGMGNYAFANCTNLKEYSVAEGNVYCEARDGVLYTTDGKTLLRYPVGTRPTEVTIPDGVESIGSSAFTGSNALTDIHFPDSVVYIGPSAFADCTALKSVQMPTMVVIIDDFAFNSCTALESVKLYDSLTTIGAAAFCNTALKTVILPNSVTTIGQQAFAQTNLTDIIIPETVTSIDFCAFGWKLSNNGELIPVSDFTVHGYRDTVAEDYATDTENGNNFKFIPFDAAAETKSAAETQTAEPKKEISPAVRIAGAAVCGVLVIAIILTALLTGRKGKKHE